MTSWKKARTILMMALFVALGGTSIATATASSATSPVNAVLSDTGTPFQSQEPPVDCKKKPEDPRCRNKPY